MDEKIASLENNLSTLSQEVVEIKELIRAGFTKVANNFTSIKNEIDTLHNKVDSLNIKINALKGDTNTGFGEVGLKLENLTDEISKIGIVTNYDKQYQNFKGIKPVAE